MGQQQSLEDAEASAREYIESGGDRGRLNYKVLGELKGEGGGQVSALEKEGSFTAANRLAQKLDDPGFKMGAMAGSMVPLVPVKTLMYTDPYWKAKRAMEASLGCEFGNSKYQKYNDRLKEIEARAERIASQDRYQFWDGPREYKGYQFQGYTQEKKNKMVKAMRKRFPNGGKDGSKGNGPWKMRRALRDRGREGQEWDIDGKREGQEKRIQGCRGINTCDAPFKGRQSEGITEAHLDALYKKYPWGETYAAGYWPLQGQKRVESLIDSMEKRLEPVLKARDDVIAEIEEKDRCKHRHEEIAGINKITASGGVEDATLLRVYTDAFKVDRDYKAGERVYLSKTAKVYIDGEPFPVEYTSRFSVVLEEAMKAGDTVPPQVQHVPGAHPRLVSLQKLSDTVEESRHEMKMGGIQSALALTMFLPVPGAQALTAGITAAKTAGITMATAAQVGKAAATYGAASIAGMAVETGVEMGLEAAITAGGRRGEWTARDYNKYDSQRQAILTALSGQEKVCGTKDWNKMDCPDYNEVLKRYKANMKRDKEGDYTISVTEFGGAGKKGTARDGVTGQCVGSEYQCDEKNEYGECIKGPASWMCNVVDATEVGGSENTTCRQRIEWLKEQGMREFEAKAQVAGEFQWKGDGTPPPGSGCGEPPGFLLQAGIALVSAGETAIETIQESASQLNEAIKQETGVTGDELCKSLKGKKRKRCLTERPPAENADTADMHMPLIVGGGVAAVIGLYFILK